MKTKSWLAYLVAVCVVLSGGMVARSQTAAKEHKVLFAVTSADPADWGMTMGNIRNLREGLKPDTVQVEVVAYGPGIAMLKKDSTVAADIKELEAAGVVFLACANAMRHHQLTLADMLEGVASTPAGIVEVVRKQEQGWVYIKAGK
jgi:intracellular sulfur oxidation DsrE/DsrF family protein